jgi:hypothetical protein
VVRTLFCFQQSGDATECCWQATGLGREGARSLLIFGRFARAGLYVASQKTLAAKLENRDRRERRHTPGWFEHSVSTVQYCVYNMIPNVTRLQVERDTTTIPGYRHLNIPKPISKCQGSIPKLPFTMAVIALARSQTRGRP